jgi:hypothetical protein
LTTFILRLVSPAWYETVVCLFFVCFFCCLCLVSSDGTNDSTRRSGQTHRRLCARQIAGLQTKGSIQNSISFFVFFFFCNDQHKAVSVARDLKQMCDGLPDPGARFRNVAKEELERLVVQGQAVKTAAHIAYLVE